MKQVSIIVMLWASAAAAQGPAPAQGPTPAQGAAPRENQPATRTPAPGLGVGAVAPQGPAIERVSFQDAIQRASVQATSAIVAADEIRRARAILVETRAGSLPALFGTATYTLLDSARTSGGATLVAQDTLAANLTLQVPLLQPTRWLQWAHASEQIDVARASEADVRRQVALTTARAYLSILAQKRLIEVSRSAREIAKARFDFAHARRVGGIGNTVDELRAEQQLATAEVNIANAEVALVRAQEALGIITGAVGPLDAVDEPDFQLKQGDEAFAAAESQRVDVKVARSRAVAAEHVARDTWVEWLPTVLANVSPFYNSPATITSPSSGWQVQFVLSLPIFEGFLRVGLKQERDTLADEARVVLEGTLKQVRSDVRLAIEEVRRQEAALTQARLASDRAKSALQLVVEAYRAGATNDLDVSTAQQQSRDADLAAVIAEDGVRQARLDLVSAVGQFP